MAYETKIKDKYERKFPIPVFTTKDLLLIKLKKRYSYTITPTDRNPSPAMEDFNANHYKVTIRNKETGERRTFVYSEGLGIKHDPINRDDEIFFGLVQSLNSDLPYSDREEFEGLGYDPDSKKSDRIYNAIVKNNEKTEELGLKDFFEDLSEEEKEELY